MKLPIIETKIKPVVKKKEAEDFEMRPCVHFKEDEEKHYLLAAVSSLN